MPRRDAYQALNREWLSKHYPRMTSLEISRSTGIPESTVRRRLQKHGLYCRDFSKGGPKGPLPEATLRQAYVNEGRSLKEIGRLVGRSGHSVKFWLCRYGIKLRTRSEAVMMPRRLGAQREKVSGENNYHWAGGRHLDTRGYIVLIRANHPSADSQNRVYEHRFIAEQILGRQLRSDEDVHHINGIKTDNRKENLRILDKSEHHRIHSLAMWEKRRRGNAHAS